MVKATLKKPAAKVETTPSKTAQKPTIDVESTVTPQKKESLDSLFEAASKDTVTGSGPEVVDVDPVSSEEQAPRENTNRALAHRQAQAGAMEGDFDSSDIRFPSLRIVNGSGKLSQTYNQGCIVYADELLFETPPSTGTTPPITFFPIMLKKQYREVLDRDAQEDGEMPRIVDSKEEVEALGGLLADFDGREANWRPMARCLFLMEQPDGVTHPGFQTPLDGKFYAPAVYYAGGMAYSRVARTLYNNYATVLRVPVIGEDKFIKKDERGRTIWLPMLHRFAWQFTVSKVVGKNFTTFQPSIRMTKVESGEEVRQFADDIIESKDKAIVDGEAE